MSGIPGMGIPPAAGKPGKPGGAVDPMIKQAKDLLNDSKTSPKVKQIIKFLLQQNEKLVNDIKNKLSV